MRNQSSLKPYESPANINSMYVHFARRCYNDYYAIYRRAYRLGGTSLQLRIFYLIEERNKQGKKAPHIMRASAAAYFDAMRNNPELDITPIARMMHQID